MLSTFKNIFLFLFIISAFVLDVACSKDKGDHNYVNQIKPFEGNAYDFLKSQPGIYDSMLLVLDRANEVSHIADTMKTVNGLTVFAVPDNSFTLAVGRLNRDRSAAGLAPISLKDVNPNQLDTMVRRYVIKGEFTSDSISRFSSGIYLNSYGYDTAQANSGYPYQMHVYADKETSAGLVRGGHAYLLFADPKRPDLLSQYWKVTKTTVINQITFNAIVHTVSDGDEFGFGEFAARGIN